MNYLYHSHIEIAVYTVNLFPSSVVNTEAYSTKSLFSCNVQSKVLSRENLSRDLVTG